MSMMYVLMHSLSLCPLLYWYWDDVRFNSVFASFFFFLTLHLSLSPFLFRTKYQVQYIITPELMKREMISVAHSLLLPLFHSHSLFQVLWTSSVVMFILCSLSPYFLSSRWSTWRRRRRRPTELWSLAPTLRTCPSGENPQHEVPLFTPQRKKRVLNLSASLNRHMSMRTCALCV